MITSKVGDVDLLPHTRPPRPNLETLTFDPVNDTTLKITRTVEKFRKKEEVSKTVVLNQTWENFELGEAPSSYLSAKNFKLRPSAIFIENISQFIVKTVTVDNTFVIRNQGKSLASKTLANKWKRHELKFQSINMRKFVIKVGDFLFKLYNRMIEDKLYYYDMNPTKIVFEQSMNFRRHEFSELSDNLKIGLLDWDNIMDMTEYDKSRGHEKEQYGAGADESGANESMRYCFVATYVFFVYGTRSRLSKSGEKISITDNLEMTVQKVEDVFQALGSSENHKRAVLILTDFLERLKKAKIKTDFSEVIKTCRLTLEHGTAAPSLDDVFDSEFEASLDFDETQRTPLPGGTAEPQSDEANQLLDFDDYELQRLLDGHGLLLGDTAEPQSAEASRFESLPPDQLEMTMAGGRSDPDKNSDGIDTLSDELNEIVSKYIKNLKEKLDTEKPDTEEPETKKQKIDPSGYFDWTDAAAHV